MDPGTASIVLISLSAATLLFNFWQSHQSGHFHSNCSYDNNPPLKESIDKS